MASTRRNPPPRGAIRVLGAFVVLAVAVLLVGCGSDEESFDAQAWRDVVNNQLRDGFFDLISGDERLRASVLDLVADDEPDRFAEMTGDDVVTRAELRSTAVSQNMVNGFASGIWTTVDSGFEDPAEVRDALDQELRAHVVDSLHSVPSFRSTLAPDESETVTVDDFAEVDAVGALADDLVRQVLFHLDAVIDVAESG